MRPFEFIRPQGLDEALRHLSAPGARAVAGGTNLVDLMKLGVEVPEILVDIRALPLQDIRRGTDTLIIGALVSNSAAAADPDILQYLPAVSEALLSGASGQIRNAATVGGNLLQRTRCSYFRAADWACAKRQPGAGCAAATGINAGHAVLGTTPHCMAVHPSDLAVALLALDATVHLRSGDGARSVPLGRFHRLPFDTPHVETALAPSELLMGIEVPVTALAKTSRYLKLRGRASYEFASASVAAAVLCEGGVVSEVAIALGGVGTVPWRNRTAEMQLLGRPLSALSIDAFCDELLAEAVTTPANAYKLSLARGAIHRALEWSAKW